MSVPVTPERKSFLPLRLRTTTGTVGPRPTLPMPIVTENNNKSSLAVGNRVLVNGLKNGTLRYIGIVQFAQGIFCGVELDEPDGKHDGQVKDVRYFQCTSNHGVFVPQDKVTLAPRARISSSQKGNSRLKPPSATTRSVTITSSDNKIEPSKSVQLPDIVPTPTTQPVTLYESLDNDNHGIILSTEQPKKEEQVIEAKNEIPSLTIDDHPIEVDFTDSVSLILHQLQQEQQHIATRSSSITISEEDTDDDEEEEDDDGESIVESTTNEQDNQTRHSSISSVFIPMDLTKSIQTDLTFHSNDHISFTKVDVLNHPSKTNKKDEKILISKTKPATQPVKKNIERRPVGSATNPTKRSPTTITPRKTSIIPTKKGPTTKTSQPITQSKQSLSPSSSISLNSSQSDLVSISKSSISKPPSDASQSIDHPVIPSEKHVDESHENLIQLEQQLTIQKTLNQSLQTDNDHLKKYYQYLLHRFDLMHILSQYYINENDQLKQHHEHQLLKAHKTNEHLKTSIEHLQSTHKNELAKLNEQNQLRLDTQKKTYEQQLNESQQKTNQLLHEKNQVDSQCLLLQEKVDGFLTAMANSEHADMLLCHVETLEKDRTSLQTVLELKNKEIVQLRAKLHEQDTHVADIITLRKRVDMAENRNQDLEYLLRQKQLSEKAAVFERDELKEQVIQLERDNYQLKFENETLRYRLHERCFSVSMISDNPGTLPNTFTTISSQLRQVRQRAYSTSSTMLSTNENERARSLSSLNYILHR